jgi:hypothetical protein
MATYRTRVQYINGLWPTQGKVISCDWSTHGSDYHGIIDLETSKVYANQAAAIAGGAGRRLWRVWHKAYADLYFGHLANSYPGPDTNEYPGVPSSTADGYLLPVAILGMGVPFNGSADMQRSDTIPRYYQPAIVLKDDKSQAWSDNDTVYLLRAATAKTPTYTKTVISGAPTVRVEASPSGQSWAGIKTLNADSKSFYVCRPFENEFMNDLSPGTWTSSDTIFAPDAVFIQKYGAVGGTLAGSVCALHGAQEMVAFYDPTAGHIESRQIDSRATWEVTEDEYGVKNFVITGDTWKVNVAVPAVCNIAAFINGGYRTNDAYVTRTMPRHEFCIDLPSVSFYDTDGSTKDAPIISDKSFQILYQTHEKAENPGNSIEANVITLRNLSAFGIRIVEKVTSDTSGPYDYTPGQYPETNLGSTPLGHSTGAILVQDSNGNRYWQNRSVPVHTLLYYTSDLLWSCAQENIEWQGYFMVATVTDEPSEVTLNPRVARLSVASLYNQTITNDVIVPEEVFPLITSYKPDPDYDETVTVKGWVGTKPGWVTTGDIVSYRGRYSIFPGNENDIYQGSASYPQESMPYVDRRQWFCDVMPMVLNIIGREEEFSLRTNYHRGSPLVISPLVTSEPTWPVAAPTVTVSRINYLGDPTKPALRVTVADPTSLLPTHASGYVADHIQLYAEIGGDCEQVRGFTMHKFGSARTVSVYDYLSYDVNFDFNIYPWPVNASPMWIVPDEGKVKVKIWATAPWADRKNPIMITTKEWMYERDLPKKT